MATYKIIEGSLKKMVENKYGMEVEFSANEKSIKTYHEVELEPLVINDKIGVENGIALLSDEERIDKVLQKTADEWEVNNA